MNSPLSLPPQPHTGNDNRDSDENNYYINVHDGSHTLFELPPLKIMDEILCKAVASIKKVMDTYNVQGDMDNDEDHTSANTDTAEKTMRENLKRKAKNTQTDPSDSSCDSEEGATIASNQQRKLNEKWSGSNNHRKMVWAVVHEYIENGMLTVNGNTEQIATIGQLTNLTVVQVKVNIHIALIICSL
ncbi:hypothetical protein BDD12DRAFT_894248 [Trichophaea hybrida]|nr:hypothetical protein BDD12DRAFT_894248 [Trichophaea hybrida]